MAWRGVAEPKEKSVRKSGKEEKGERKRGVGGTGAAGY